MKPTITTKTRDPKYTDFSKHELVININKGSLFYKSNLGVHKLFPTSTIAVTPNVVIPPTAAIWTETGNDIYYNTGKVGIGTATPQHPLHVKDETTSNGTILSIDNEFGESPKSLLFTYSEDIPIAKLTGFGRNLTTTLPYFSIEVNNTTSGGASSTLTERLRILADGNVGIGTTSPGEILELNGNLLLNTGNIRSTGDIDLLTDNTAQHAEDKGYMKISSAAASTTINGDLNLVANHTIIAASAEDYAHRGCNVSGGQCGMFGGHSFMAAPGIGNFTCEGDAQIDGELTVGGATIPAGTFPQNTTPLGSAAFAGILYVGGPSTKYTSDKKLKKNIISLKDPLSKILSLRGVTFEWKDKTKGEETQYGFIAQEVEEIIPELVTSGETKYLNYTGIIPVLVEAIKNQQKQIDELKSKIK